MQKQAEIMRKLREQQAEEERLAKLQEEEDRRKQ
jgi:hypothetical protein